MRKYLGLFVALFLMGVAPSMAASRLKHPKVYNPTKEANAVAASSPKRIGGIVKFGQDVEIRSDDAVDGGVFVVNGNVSVAGTVEGPVVAIGGSVALKSGASVGGPVVSIGGHSIIEPGASTEGPLVELPRSFVPWRMLGLTLGPAVGILGSYWLVYKIFNTIGWIALSIILWILFPKALENSRDTLIQQPKLALLTGIVFWPSLGIICVIFLVSILGIPLLPILVLGATCAWFWGFTTMGFYLGERLAAQGYWEKPAVSILVGTTILRMLEWLPVLGFLVYLAVAVLGIGVSLISRFGARQA